MSVQRVTITPFDDQKPGTSGLRKKTEVFRRPHYLAAFVQAIFQVQKPDGPLVLGGDGRFFNDEALQLILRIAAANSCRHVIVARDGLLSTPAASHLIRSRGACGGIILSASHNAGGPDGDFGIKFNGPNGAPAAEDATDAVFALSKGLTEYRLADAPVIDLSRVGDRQLDEMRVEVVDPTQSYADLMAQLFDFPLMAQAIASGRTRIAFDAMHAVTGPYAREVLIRRLGAPAGALIRGEPLPDFGGGHPDPNTHNAAELMALMDGAQAPDLGAASDGDGDRHLVVGPGFPVSPSDSVAILAANADLIPGYKGRLAGVARSMPTSRALDAVAAQLGLPCYETPTGWKFFGSLLDAGKITICGEESAGAGSDHVREKDGLWAVLFWLNIVAARGQSVEEIVRDHWARFGRHAFVRLDYEDLPLEAATALMAALGDALPTLPGTAFGDLRIEAADDFAYVDPITGASAAHQGVRLMVSGGGRIVLRLSGTGTSGATLRIYLEQHVTDSGRIGDDAGVLTRPLETLAVEVARLAHFTGRLEPTHRV